MSLSVRKKGKENKIENTWRLSFVYNSKFSNSKYRQSYINTRFRKFITCFKSANIFYCIVDFIS